MSFLIDKNTKLLVQGITGKEGLKAAKEMLDYGTKAGNKLKACRYSTQ